MNVAASLAGRNVDVAALLASVGLTAEYADRLAAELSGGEQQRVSIARALATNPEVLLMDEPTSALDPEVADRLMTTVHALGARMNMTTIMVTHRLAEARSVSTYTVMLEAGNIVEAGLTEASLFMRATSARARTYLRAEA